MHLYDSLPKPVIFAHRGASLYAPENTLSAFSLAVQQGARAFELDAMLTWDGVPVVIHDQTLQRTTDGEGEVCRKTAAQIRKLDAGIHFSKEFRGEKIPLLEEVLESFHDDILINIELKNYHSPKDDLARAVLSKVTRHEMLDRVIFSSFLTRNLRMVRSQEKEAKTALLTPGGLPGQFFRSFLFRSCSPDIIHPNFEDISRDSIEKEHRQGRCVNVWTVNDLESARNLIYWGVDGLITDDPRRILATAGQ